MTHKTNTPDSRPYTLAGQYSALLALSRAVDAAAADLRNEAISLCLEPDTIDVLQQAITVLERYVRGNHPKG